MGFVLSCLEKQEVMPKKGRFGGKENEPLKGSLFLPFEEQYTGDHQSRPGELPPGEGHLFGAH